MTLTCFLGRCFPFQRCEYRKCWKNKRKWLKGRLRQTEKRKRKNKCHDEKRQHLTCFAARRVGRARKARAKTRHRLLAQKHRFSRQLYWVNGKGMNPTKRWDGMNKTLTLGQNIEPPDRNGNVFHREECRKVKRRHEHDGCKHVHNPFDLFQKPFPMFRGGAAGSAAANRRRQEAELLNGLKQLLSNLNQHQDDDDRTDTRQRGRSPSAEWNRNQWKRNDTPRSAPKPPEREKSPKRGKGKGNGGLRVVSFKNDQDANLVAALKALTLEAETGGANLITKLKQIVLDFSEHDDSLNSRGPRNNVGPKPALQKPNESMRPQSVTQNNPRRNWYKLDPAWWTKAHAAPKSVRDKLDSGEAPQGTVVFVATEEAQLWLNSMKSNMRWL